MYCKECGENLSEQEVEENGTNICHPCKWEQEDKGTERECTCEACMCPLEHPPVKFHTGMG